MFAGIFIVALLVVLPLLSLVAGKDSRPTEPREWWPGAPRG
jgi:hypothetical protein